MHEQCNTHFLNSKLVLLIGEEEKKKTRQGLTLRVVPNKREEVLGLLLVVKKMVMLIVEGFLGNSSCWISVGKLAFPPPLSHLFLFSSSLIFSYLLDHIKSILISSNSLLFFSLFLGSFLLLYIFFHIFFSFLYSFPSSFIISQLKLTSNTLIFFLSLSWLLSLTSGSIPPLFFSFCLFLSSSWLTQTSKTQLKTLFSPFSLFNIFSLQLFYFLFFLLLLFI